MDTAGEEVGVDVLEAGESGEAAAAAEAGGNGGDAVEGVDLLGEGEGEEIVLVGGDEGADAGRGKRVGAEARDIRVREGAVEMDGARHRRRHLEGEDANDVFIAGRGRRRRGSHLGGSRRKMRTLPSLKPMRKR